MKDKIELKPCPFCGGEARLEKDYDGGWSAFVMCDKCLARTGLISANIRYCANDKAIEVWNNRVSGKEKDPCSAATEQESKA